MLNKVVNFFFTILCLQQCNASQLVSAEVDFSCILLLFLVTLLSLSIYAKNYIKKQPNVELNFFSKETFLIINNLLLSVIAFTVFLGTIYPLIVETINNNRISVGPPFYNITVIPFAILLAFFSALGPILAWNQNSIKQLLRNISIPGIRSLSKSGPKTFELYFFLSSKFAPT